jgi:alpha-tubulin suppressor-like RCC1 family protein
MAENNKNNFLKKFKVLNELKEDFLNEIKLLYVFKENDVLIVTNDDKVFAFGDNNRGVLGFGHEQEVNELTINEHLSHKQIIDFKNSYRHVIARTINKKVYCWGCNKYGVLGNGKNDFDFYKPESNQYLSDKQIIDICCGSELSLVLTNSGEVYAWGKNSYGQVGNGRSGPNKLQLIPMIVSGFNDEKVIQISCGKWHSMALTESGRVFSWGSNKSGQLGHNNSDKVVNKPSIVLLSNEIPIKKISGGYEHSLILSCDGDIYWFGCNGVEEQKTPKEIICENKFIDIASHNRYYISIALSMNGIYYVWGKCGEEVIKDPQKTEFKSFNDIFNHYFEITCKVLNIDSEKNIKSKELMKSSKTEEPEELSLKKFKVLEELKEEFLNEIKLLHVFKDNFNKNNVLIVTNDDKVFAFGNNNRGVLGFGNEIEVNELTINEHLSHKQIIDFKNSFRHVIALTIGGKFYCWGCNKYGVLGNGKNDCKICSPELNKYLSNKKIIDICCGECYTLVLTNSGEVYAWGRNEFGQIGNEKSGGNECQLIPIKVNGFNDEKVKQISCGFEHSMALTESGRVFSWGSNKSRQLGHNNKDYRVNKPSPVLLSNEIQKISCGQYHSLLLSRDADIYWFGCNGIEEQKTPKKIINENKFIEIKSHSHYCISIALSVNGIYYVWDECGENEKIKEPKKTEFKSFDDIFEKYFGITYKTIYINLHYLKNGKYEKEFEEKGLIGCGSFGIVYKSIKRIDGKIYAIKKIALNENEINFATKELNIISQLKSNFVVEFINCWVENNNYIKAGNMNKNNITVEEISYSHSVFDPKRTLLLHIQMEYCLKTLQQLINKELTQQIISLRYFISSELFVEILECVQYLHKENIIHRDLKPENILIYEGMNARFVKLCDFGLAVIHEFEDQSHSSKTGSLKYMAPEVFEGRKYDMKADIYSLGVILEDLLKDIISQNNSELEMKFSNLKELITKMKSYGKELRPNCDEILSDKEKWTLNRRDLNKLISEKTESLDKKSFQYLFITNKITK